MVEQISEEAANRKQKFLGWQCLIRQYAVRQNDGRPSPGMRPLLALPNDVYDPYPVTTLIHKVDCEEITAELQFLAQKTLDPKIRFDEAVKYLSAIHYQRSRDFGDQMTALFSNDSKFAQTVINADYCDLKFTQNNQSWSIRCATAKLADTDKLFQATYLHNKLFNPKMPAQPLVIGFMPDWASAKLLEQ